MDRIRSRRHPLPNWKLRRERRRRGWSQDDLANQLAQAAAELGAPEPDVDRGTISRWERGIRHPQPHYVRLLCHRFALSADQLGLLEGEGEDPRWPTDNAFDEIRSRLISLSSLDLDVYAVTAHNLDILYKVDLVLADHEVKVGPPLEMPGGSGANTAYALGKLGARAAVTGAVADDRAGGILRQDLARGHVDVHDLAVVPANAAVGTGTATIFIDSAGRPSIYVNPGVNEGFASLTEDRRLLSSLVERLCSSRIVHFSSFTAAAELRLQERLVANMPESCIVSLTPGPLYARLGLDRLTAILRRVNVIHMQERQFDLIMEGSSIGPIDGVPLQEKIERFFTWRAKRGFTEPVLLSIKPRAGTPPEWAIIVCGRTSVEELVPTIRALNLPQGVDTTGVVDGMAAGLLFGLLLGRSLAECADLAVTMGAYAASQLGARTGLPDRRQLQPWLGGLA